MSGASSVTVRWRAALASIEASPWGVLLPMAVAAVLGITTIGSKSMWLDEGFSASVIQLSTFDLLRYLFHHEMQALPYYPVLQAWSALGHDETWLRLLSVVFGVAGVAASYALGRRFGVGLAAAMLLAVSPYFIHYEQEVRAYTLLVAWSVITTLAYVRLLERPNRWRALAYVIAATGLLYIHTLSGWMLVAHALLTFVSVGRPWRWRLLALYIPVLILATPIFRFLIINRDRVDWIPIVTPSLVGHEVSQLLGAALLALALTVVTALGLARGWRRELPILRLPLLLVTLMIGGVLLMSLLIQPLFVSRYFIGVLPFVFIIVPRAVSALPWPRAILAGLLGLSLLSTGSWLVNGVKDDWRAAVAHVESNARPGDGVIIWPNFYRLPFAYYGTPGEPLYPSTPWSTLYLPLWGMSIDLPPDVDNERIWLVRSDHFVPPADIAALLTRYEEVDVATFGTAQPEIVLLVRR